MKFKTLVISLSATFAQASSSFTTNDATTDTAAVVSEHQLQRKLLLDNISNNVHPDPIKRALTPKYAKNKKNRSKTNVPVPPVVPVPPIVPDTQTVRKFEGTYVYPGCGGGFYRANIDCDFDNDLCVYEEFLVGTVYDTDLVGEDILDDSFISVGDPDSSNYYIKPSTVEDPELICTFFGTFSASTAGKERTNELKPIALSVSDTCNDVSKAKQYVVKVGSLFDRVYLSFSQDGGETYYTQDQPRSTTKVDTEGEERRKLAWCSSYNPFNLGSISGCPGQPPADPWVKTEDSDCGGSTIRSLEDGTSSGWRGTVNDCKTRCGASVSCTAFFRDVSSSTNQCIWKRGVSAETMTSYGYGDCYFHLSTDSPTKAPTVDTDSPTQASTNAVGNPWAEKRNSICGGDTISYLEDGTPNGWNPNSGDKINKCKTRCKADRSCTAFIFNRYSNQCFWRKGVSTATMTASGYSRVCHYLHEEVLSIAPTISPKPTPEPTPESTPEPTPEPTITPTSSPKPTPEPTPEPSISPTISQAPTDSPTNAPTVPPEAVSKITWTVKEDSQCGGSNISPLADGTPYGWKPNSLGSNSNINKCRKKCVDSASCTAFIWGKTDSSCRWKKGVSAETMFQDERHDCYSLHEEVVSTTWTVKNSWCNGDVINRLEDGTPNSWVPSTEGYDINMCKSKCVFSPSCVAFDWNDAIRICYWHSRISDYPQTKGYKCYSYEINAPPTTAPGGWSCEPLSTLAQNNFNDKVDTELGTKDVISYTLANGYPVQLTGWSHTRNYAYGYLRTKGRNWDNPPMAVVSGLVAGGIYAFKVYQYAYLNAGTNPLSVNGISWGETTSSTSMEATAEGEATADGQGKITFTFTAQSNHVQLSGLAIGRCQAPPTNE